jgi:Ca2+-binding EF-hand superfamily protein
MSKTPAKQEDAPWGGGCPWQYDKTSFKTWLKNAVDNPTSKDRKELYGYLSECFLDADVDRNGLVDSIEFDFMTEKAAAMPRRFGLAPSWNELYGDVAHRQEARRLMFLQMDKHKRGMIGMEEWIEFCMSHIIEKTKQIDWQQLDFCHLENSDQDQFLVFLAIAMQDKHSEQYKAFYEFLFKTFVESDVKEKGYIVFEQFGELIEAAARAPRKLGLAPQTDVTYKGKSEQEKTKMRRLLFEEMDIDKNGKVTFDKFLVWSMAHTAKHVNEAMSTRDLQPPKTKKRYQKAAPWGGGCAWQHDKTAFKTWIVNAMAGADSPERKELYGFLAECFIDSDGDRNGLIDHFEFDFLVEKSATLPRRFGVAPAWTECYGDVAHRMEARKGMFAKMDKHKRGLIGLEEWVEFSMTHIADKVKEMSKGEVDFAHLDSEGVTVFVDYCEKALADQKSEAYKSLYEHLLKTFVEADSCGKGAVTIDQFDILIDDAAHVPRSLGLAPTTAKAYKTVTERRKGRQTLFDTMDKDKNGTITFDEFLKWTLAHTAQHIKAYRAK